MEFHRDISYNILCWRGDEREWCSFLFMKLYWHNYIVFNLDNCAIKLVHWDGPNYLKVFQCLNFIPKYKEYQTRAGQSLQETQALPRVYGFAEGFLSGPRQRKSLPSTALGTTILTTLQPLPRVGPSAGWDPRHNQVFAEGQRSARRAPSEKERAPSHYLGCCPLWVSLIACVSMNHQNQLEQMANGAMFATPQLASTTTVLRPSRPQSKLSISFN
jgi:hypothetical protein